MSLFAGSRIFMLLVLVLMNFSSSQTHFTIPQNVWRISLDKKLRQAKWKGHNGKNGWQNYSYNFAGNNYNLTQFRQQSGRTSNISLEYGISNSITVGIKIPYINKFEEKSIWAVSPDSGSAVLIGLLDLFYPEIKNNSGLGDISLGVNKLLKGKPAWSGKGKFSIFAGFEVILPFAERLGVFNSTKTDSSNRPLQFKELPLGLGLTEWKGKVFGEFFYSFRQRLINFTWLLHFSNYSRELVYSPITFLWTEEETDPDSLANSTGLEILFKQGNQAGAGLSGQLELIQKRIFLTAGMNWTYALRNKYISNSSIWDAWMVKHKNFDSRYLRTNQFLRFNFLNIDPLKKIGPIPFELEIGLGWFVPLLTKNSFGVTESWIKVSSYLQGW